MHFFRKWFFQPGLTIFGRKNDMNSQMTKRCRHFLLDIITTRGLRRRRYSRVALRGFRKPGKWKKILCVYFSRGAYAAVAIFVSPLGAFFIQKNDILVVQAQKGVDQEVNHPISD